MQGLNGGLYLQRSDAQDKERARSALMAIDAGCDRETWVRLGMAAKAAGLDESDFVAWSEGAGNFDSERDCRSVWRSIRSDGGITQGTLYALARDAGWNDSRPTTRRAREYAPGPRNAAQEARTAVAKGKMPASDFAAVWRDSEPATEAHPYIVRKLGLALGLRVYRGTASIAGQPLDGALMVPAFDGEGVLQSWQAIPAGNGKKFNAKGASMSGARFVVGGAIRDGGTVYLCEGIGAAWSVHQASTRPALCCFGAGNVERVAVDIHARHPGAKLVVVADRGKEADAERIARAVGGAWVGLPDDWPANSDVNDMHKRDGLQAVAELLGKSKAAESRFRLLTFEELAALPPVRWRIRGVLPAEGLSAVFGPSSSGKSFLTFDALGAIVENRPWFGHRVDPCPVTYVALEGQHGFAQRAAAYRVRFGTVLAGMKFMAQPFALLEPGDVAELALAIKAGGGANGIVAIDTLNRASSGSDENDSRDMGRVIDGAKMLQSALGGLVLLVHHTGKDVTRGLRGHSSLHAALDAAIEVTRDGERREWRTSKAKDGADGDAHPFRLEVVELGSDDQGEPVTSCVIEPEERAADAVRRVKLPQGGNQRIVWDALGEAFRLASDYGQAGAPAGRPCLRLEAAIAHCHGRLTCASDRQSERVRDAITGLVTRGCLELREGWLWCA